MNHAYISEADLVNRYLMRSLTAEESAAFEEHFVDCPECADNINTTRVFIHGLRSVVVDEHTARSDQSGLWRWFRSMSFRQLAATAGVILLAFVVVVALIDQLRRSRDEIGAIRSSALEWQRQYEAERDASALAEKRFQDSEQKLNAEVAQLRDEVLAKENERAQPDGTRSAQINVPIFSLSSTRGGGSVGTITEIRLPRSAARFIIHVSLEGDSSYVDYLIKLEKKEGTLIWQSGGLKPPDGKNGLLVGFDRSYFRRGEYVLTVEGISAERRARLVGKYALRIM